jgi:hypothetical protein
VTAPDPLKCMAIRAAHDESLCNEPESAHCPDCELCPGMCACPPATTWKKGDRVRITFDAIYYAEPSIKPDRYALVVLPGTDLDGNPLILDRFRVPLDAMARLDTAPAETDL